MQLTMIADDAHFRQLVHDKIATGARPGPSGWTGEMIKILLDDAPCRQGLIILTTDICNGAIPRAAQNMLRLSKLIPLDKSGPEGQDPDNPQTRPIAIGEVFLRLAAIYVCSALKEELATALLPINFAVGASGGSAVAVLLLRSLRRTGGNIMSCDFANAFNNVSRTKIFEALLGEPKLAGLLPLTYWLYGTASSLYVYRRGQSPHLITSTTGTRQGCVLGTALFCIAVKPLFASVIERIPTIRAVAISDDINLVGTVPDTIQAFDTLEELSPQYGLSLTRPKCFLTPRDALTPTALAQLSSREIAVNTAGRKILGAPFGPDDQSIKEVAESIVRSHDTMFSLLSHPNMDPKVAYMILRMCMAPRLSYLMRTTPHHLLTAALSHFDTRMEETFLHITQIPRTSIGVSALRRISLPLRQSGFGIRPSSTTAPLAYVASMALALPHLPVDACLNDDDLLATVRLIRSRYPNTASLLPSRPDQLRSKLLHRANSEKLQNRLSRIAELHTMSHIFRPDLSNDELAHLLSASGPLASAWLTAIPTSRATTMCPEQFRLACRLRLGVSPTELPLPISCPRCHDPLQANPWHPLSCSHTKKGAAYRRHNSVLQPVIDMVRAFYGSCSEAPVGWISSDRTVPDLFMSLPDEHPPWVIDEAIVHPLAPSHIHRASSAPLVTALAMEAIKTAKYAPVIPPNVAFVPLVQETLGAFAPGTIRILKRIAAHGATARGIPPHESFQTLASQMAIRLQIGNAIMVKSALDVLHHQ